MPDESFAFSHRLVARFSDCDAMGHVNHAVYFTYLEQCRFMWWRHLGSPSGMPGVATVIAHAECDYRSPAFVHDELEIRVRAERIGRTSVTLLYEIVNVATGTRCADGKTVSVTVDRATGVAIPVPEGTRALLERGASAP